MGPASFESRAMMVSDLLCPLTNKWEVEKIRRFLPQYEDAILQIKTSSTPSIDTLVWLPERSGNYSTKTGYGIKRLAMSDLDPGGEPVNWLKHIWNVKTGPKLKDFLWRVVKKAIPVSSNLERRGFPRFNCKSCGAHEDDIHVLLKCPLATEVWNQAPISTRPSSALTSITDLIKQGDSFNPLPPVGLASPLWPWILWNLWKARNKLVFENRVFTAKEVILKSIKDAKEWCQAQSENRGSTSLGPSLNRSPPRAAHPPPTFQPEVLVCKVDAAWDVTSGRCGISGIYCENATISLPNFAEAHHHVSSALMAEAIAVHRAVSLA
ncbi:hypothetical protein Bca52824_025305, partial [Brassica carinata]